MTTPTKVFLYDEDRVDASEAVTEAQRIAFAPIIFQAAVSLRDFGILAFLHGRAAKGATLEELAESSGLSKYAAGVLLDAGLSARILFEKEDHFFIGRVGICLLKNNMTRINMNFTRDICYAGMAKLSQALLNGSPAGLEVLGDWATIYQGLSSLPEPAKTSWFAFDHFYSDNAFDLVIEHVFRYRPKHIYDVGGNTGRWAVHCVTRDPEVRVTVLDLPQQVVLLQRELAKIGGEYAARIDAHPVNILEDTVLPDEADVWWMSQFLDCFSEEQLVGILTRIRRAMKPDARIFILEPLCDRQEHEAAALTLNASSLYFTCMANGNSRFFRSRSLDKCLARAGLTTETTVDGLGLGGHTLTVARVKH
jgi:hypothetical protein